MRKAEILGDKSDGLHQSKNMGCDLRQCNFSTLVLCLADLDILYLMVGCSPTASIFKFMHLGDSWICVHVTGKHPSGLIKRPSSQ